MQANIFVYPLCLIGFIIYSFSQLAIFLPAVQAFTKTFKFNNRKIIISTSMQSQRQQTQTQTQTQTQPTTTTKVIDIGINLTNGAFKKHWKNVVQRAIDEGVEIMILTGTSIKNSQLSLQMAQEWFDETGTANLFVTIGIHPHDAKTWKDDDDDNDDGTNDNNTNNKNEESPRILSTLQIMKQMLRHPLAIAVGECGLDYNRNFSTKGQQKHAFRQQVILACELSMPMFVHEREAYDDTIKVLDEVQAQMKSSGSTLPPIVIHCFTGTEREALSYIERGYYLGFTGTICKHQRGEPLRALLPKLPPDRLMVETDAPFMGFKKKERRRNSEPADCIDVAKKLSETIGEDFKEVCQLTTSTTISFFRLEEATANAMPLAQATSSPATT